MAFTVGFEFTLQLTFDVCNTQRTRHAATHSPHLDLDATPEGGFAILRACKKVTEQQKAAKELGIIFLFF